MRPPRRNRPAPLPYSSVVRKNGRFPGVTGLARGGAARAVASLFLLVLAVIGGGQGQPPSAPVAVPAARQAKNVAIITIHGQIDSVTAQSFTRRVHLAERAGAGAIVVELDTPGGAVDAVLAMTSVLKNSSISNTVAWINPQAYSGGAVIALACREIVMAPSASVGDALPIYQDETGRWHVLQGELLKKMLPPLMADLVDSARRYGRDEYLVQAMCNDTVELWLIREKATGRVLCIDAEEYQNIFGSAPARGMPRIPSVSADKNAAPAPTLKAPTSSHKPSKEVPAAERYRPASPELGAIQGAVDNQIAQHGGAAPSTRPTLTSADADAWEPVCYLTNGTGPIVLKHDDLQLLGIASATIANDEELKAFFGARNLTRLDPSWSEGLYAFLTWLPVRGVLVAIFLLALFIEMTHPGTMLPGGIAFAALVALVAPPLLINMSAWWAVAAILAGILMIVLEVLVIPGFGVFGLAGLLLLFGGLIGVLVPSGSLFPDTAAERQDLLYGVMTLALSLATSGVGMYFFAKHFRSLPVLNRLVLQDPVWDDERGGDEFLAAMGAPSGPVRKGMTGITLTPLRPAGRVELGAVPGEPGRIIDVVSEVGYIPAGAKVRILSVSDFRISVEHVEGPAAASGERTA